MLLRTTIFQSLSILLCCGFPLLANAQNIDTPYFSLPLPDNLKAVTDQNNQADVSTSKGFHEYIYSSKDANPYSFIAFTAIIALPVIPDGEKIIADDESQRQFIAGYVAGLTKGLETAVKDSDRDALSRQVQAIKVGDKDYKELMTTIGKQHIEIYLTAENGKMFQFMIQKVGDSSAQDKQTIDAILDGLKKIHLK